MSKVSQPRPVRSRLARSLQGFAGVAGVTASLGLWATGSPPGYAQTALSGSRQVEAQRVDRPSDDERMSLKRALAAGDQPSGNEQRKQLSREERRALLQDLREVARDVNQNRAPVRSRD